jgi:predicted secreted hydrolase
VRAGTAVLAFLAAGLLAACGSSDTGPASDFAVLAGAEEGFETARPGRRLEFPADHGAHPAYRIEWWYLTANLQDDEGAPHGAQWTLFRVATRPPGTAQPLNAWDNEQLFMAHFALTWPDGHRGWQRYSRGGNHAGIARAGVSAEPFAAWLDDWRMHSTGTGWTPLEVRARQEDHAMALVLSSDRGPVLQGDAGFSLKHESGTGSYYYSQPFLQARGTVEIDGRKIPVKGQAWLDHEWSSQFLQPGQEGWDWFAIHLENGQKLMVFQLRNRNGDGGGDFRHGVLVRQDGTTQTLDPEQISLEAVKYFTVEGRRLPLNWRLELPEIGRRMDIRALHPQQWMAVDFPYWEGVILVTGDDEGSRGEGYMELTGYTP